MADRPSRDLTSSGPSPRAIRTVREDPRRGAANHSPAGEGLAGEGAADRRACRADSPAPACPKSATRNIVLCLWPSSKGSGRPPQQRLRLTGLWRRPRRATLTYSSSPTAATITALIRRVSQDGGRPRPHPRFGRRFPRPSRAACDSRACAHQDLERHVGAATLGSMRMPLACSIVARGAGRLSKMEAMAGKKPRGHRPLTRQFNGESARWSANAATNVGVGRG